jgi:hypothetical protein
MTDEEIKGFAACQAWATSVYKSPDSFPEEWVAWTLGLQSTGIASPMNDEWSPFRSNPLFREALRTTREALAKEQASSDSPSYKQAHDICMTHVELLKREAKLLEVSAGA